MIKRKNKSKIATFLLVFMISNLFIGIIGFKPITVSAETLGSVYSDRYTYNEIAREYTSPSNNLTIKVNYISKVENTLSNTYEIWITQRNDTDKPIEEGFLRLHYHDGKSEVGTTFVRTLMPGEVSTKQYSFNVSKGDIPWMIVYTTNIFDSNLDTLLKWDLTPDEYKGMSSNTNLKTVETNFGSDIKQISVPNSAESININPIPEDSKATVTGGGVHQLKIGDNKFIIEVISEMGIKKEYEFVVRRLSNDANLSSLKFSEGTLSPAFDKDINKYTLNVDKNKFTLSVLPTTSDKNARVKYKSSIYIDGSVTESIKVIAEDGTEKVYTVDIISPSKDPTLSNIIFNDGEINFDFNPNSNKQELRVDADVSTLKINAITSSANATIESGNGTFDLKEGENKFSIKVVAEDTGYYKYYDLIVYRTNNNTNLKGIYFGSNDGYLIEGFNPNKTEYEFDIIRNEDRNNKYRLYAYSESYKSKIEYNFNHDIGLYVSLAIGKNEFKIKCISEQGESKEYTLIINYKNPSSNAKLEKLSFDVGTMKPAFNPDINSYTITVPRNTNKINVVDIKAQNEFARITNISETGYSPQLDLPNLENEFIFKVVAQDGKTVNRYKIKVIKIRNSDSSLSNLSIGSGELKPKFDKNIKNYSATVSNSIDSINIIAQAADMYTAQITGGGNHKLVLGANKFTIVVTAEDGSKSEYYININRNNLPTIECSDIILPYGDEIDLTRGVKAIDLEDGDITSKVIATPMQEPIGSIGTYDIQYKVTDSAGDIVYKMGKLKIIERSVKVTETIGKDRYDTAVQLSRLKFTKSDTAIIVNGDALADGLAITPLAVYYNAPILLTEKNSIPKYTIDELKRLGVKNIIIAGGTSVVSNNVVNQLKGLGISKIERLAGLDRYDTSLEIAKYIDINCYDIENIAVCYGYGEADALSISAVAGRDRMAIIMVDKNSIPVSIENWLKKEAINNAYIVGGTSVISNNVLNKINSITKMDIKKNRLGGKDRYHTNSIILEKFYGKDMNKVYVAKGSTLVDALAAGNVAALDNGPVMLVDNLYLTEEQYTLLNKKLGKEIIRAGGGISNDIIKLIEYHLKS